MQNGHETTTLLRHGPNNTDPDRRRQQIASLVCIGARVEHRRAQRHAVISRNAEMQERCFTGQCGGSWSGSSDRSTYE